MKVVTFPKDIAQRNYRMFCNEWESDELIFFHGTTYSNRESIESDGFKPAAPLSFRHKRRS
jgi:hypothetical protein